MFKKIMAAIAAVGLVAAAIIITYFVGSGAGAKSTPTTTPNVQLTECHDGEALLGAGVMFTDTAGTATTPPVTTKPTAEDDNEAVDSADDTVDTAQDETAEESVEATDSPDTTETVEAGATAPASDSDTPAQTGMVKPAETDAAKTEGTAGTTAKTEAVTTGKAVTQITVSFSLSNSWEESGKTCSQLTAVVKNSGSAACGSWKAELDVGSGAELVQGWNAVYSLSGGKLTMSNEAYNGEIPAGGTVEIGFIIKTSGSVKLSDATGTGSAAVTTQPADNGGNGGASSQGGSSETVTGTPPAAYTPTTKTGKTDDDWLYVSGNKIVDKNGKEVWLTGVNWFGYNTGTNTFDGLWACNLESSIQAIADHGFNLLRIPMSVELVNQWAAGTYPQANYNHASNATLDSMNSLEIFDYTIGLCKSVGIKIMIDMHCAKTDSMGHMYNVWYNGDVSAEDFYSALEWLAARYKKDDTVIAYDLKNEPHGKPTESPKAIWNDSSSDNNWKSVAEKAAKRILAKNPNVLIMVEGIEIYPMDIKKNGDYSSTSDKDYYYNWWGGNLRGVGDFPINLGKYQNKLVYSPHDYGPAVYQQPWFTAGYDYDSLMDDCWYDNWFYIYDKGTAPLLIGEWGGYMTEPNLTWMTHLRTLIGKYKLHHTFWCFNANSGDTGGLVKDDFVTWDSEKYNFVKEVLWQKNGKFVGLDHVIPLGTNGISLSSY